jgi:phage FluMu gp28-like protein
MTDTPTIMLPYQVGLLSDKSRIRLVEKSRRVGVSWAIAAEMALDAASEDGCDGWYTGYNKDMTQEFIRDVAFWAKKYDFVCDEVEEGEIFEKDADKSILTYTIRFASGWRVTALSSRPANFRNKQGHICIDEAAHHEDLEGMLKAALAVKMWGRHGRIDIISTHHGEDNAFNMLVKETRAQKRPYSLHRVTIHDALKDGLFKRICLVNDEKWAAKKEKAWLKNLFAEYGDAAKEELECIPSKSGGVYIGRNLIERAMVLDGDILRLELEDEFLHWPEESRIGHIEHWCAVKLLPLLKSLTTDKLHFFGEDFGRTTNRTVIAVGQLTTKLKRRFPVVVEMLNVPFEAQRQVLFYIVDRLPRFFHGVLDSNGNGSYLAEVALQRYGETKITCAKITEPWYHENLPPFRAVFEDEQIEMIPDVDHMLDLTAFQVIQGQPKLPKLTKKAVGVKGPDRHGDAGIAYLCAHIASKQPISTYAYDTPQKKHKERPLTGRASDAAQLRTRKGGIL